MNTERDEWIGVAEIAAEMKYTPREAWEFVRRIGLVAVNVKKMDRARFTRAEFDEARDRAKAALAPRARTGAISAGAKATATSKPAAVSAAAVASKRAKLRGI